QVVRGQRVLEVRTRDLDDLGAETPEGFHRGPEGSLDAGLVSVARQFAHDTHADTLQVAARAFPGRDHHVGDRDVEAGRVAGIVAGDHLMQKCRVLDGPGAGPALV